MNTLLSNPFSDIAVSSVDWNDHGYEKYESLWNAYSPQLDIIHKILSRMSPESATRFGNLKKQIEIWSKMLAVSRERFNDLSRDQIGIISETLEKIRKSIIHSYDPASRKRIQEGKLPGTQPQLRVPKQQRNTSLPRFEAASSPQMPDQLFMPTLQVNKINTAQVSSVANPEPKIGAISMNRQTRRQVVQPQNLTQHALPPLSAFLYPDSVKKASTIPQVHSVKGADHPQGPAKNDQTGVISMNRPARHRVVQAQSLTQPIQPTLLDPKKQPISVRNVASDPDVSSTLHPLSAFLYPNSLKKASTISQGHSAKGSDPPQGPAKNDQTGVISMNRPSRHQVVRAQSLPQPIQYTLLDAKKQPMSVQNVASDPKVSSTTSLLSISLSQKSLEKVSKPGSASHPQGPAKDDQTLSQTTNKDQASSTGSPKILSVSPSPLMAEVTLPEERQSGHSDESSIQRLLDAVKSITNEALFATVQDIDSIVSTMDLVDVKSESQDSTDCPRNLLPGRNSYYLYGTASARRIERHFGVLTKMPEYQVNKAGLLDEIEEINKRLVETRLDLVLDDSNTGSSEGTIIRCSYCPVGLSRNIELRKSDSKLLPLFCARLLVPVDYPKSCPVLLDDDSSVCGGLSEEAAVQGSDVTKRFSSSLCELPSLKEIARKWDDCARSVLAEFAASTGGGSLSTKLGKWESCCLI